MNRKRRITAARLATICLTILLAAGAMDARCFAATGTNKNAPVSSDVRLAIDGQPVECDVAPYIYGERTMVPFRAIGEAIGAVVGWDGDSKIASYDWRGNYVQVMIDSENAFVNGTWTKLDEPAQLTGERTFVPVRFVAESLGCAVDWDDAMRTVLITTPSPESMRARIARLETEPTENGCRLRIAATRPLENVRKSVAEGKMTVRIENAYIAGNAPVLAETPFFTDVTVTADGNDVVIGIALKRQIAGALSFSAAETECRIAFEEGAPEGDDNAFTKAAQEKGLPALDWRAAGSLVVLDPGHGGRDSGSVGKTGGKSVYEKTINLDIALRTRELLAAAGVRVVMTREDDSFPALYERPTLANTLHADLTVALHNNSNSIARVHGTEIHYHVMEKEAGYPVDSKVLATFLYEEMTEQLHLTGRGLVDNSNLALVNRCLMPSAIVEGAYISNPDEVAYMMTDEFRKKYALAVARAVIRTLNASVGEQR